MEKIQIISSYDPETAEKKINNAIVNGWKRDGELKVVAEHNAHGTGDIYYVQVMSRVN